MSFIVDAKKSQIGTLFITHYVDKRTDKSKTKP